MFKSSKVIALLQIGFFIAMITINAMANILPINGYNTGEISNMYPNLFVPAGFTFGIWGVIYFLLLLYVSYSTQLLWKQNEQTETFKVANYTAPLFILSCTLNALWIVNWHYLYIFLSLIIMLWLLRTLISITNKNEAVKNQLTTTQQFLLFTPFVFYLAWICVATIANTTALLVSIHWNGFNIAPWIWSCIMIVIACVLATVYTLKRRAVAFALVIAWALFGIYKGQSTNTSVSAFAIAGAGICIVLAIIGSLKIKNKQLNF
jgi:hypothetical protein